MVNQMESTHTKLNEAFDSLKAKSSKSTEDYLKAKAEVNEYKSLLSFKETQVGPLFKRIRHHKENTVLITICSVASDHLSIPFALMA